VSVIPGTDLANQYVVVGAHYDHLGGACESKTPGDMICNGATDNAAGTAAVLGVGRAIARAKRRRRSVVLALWDREEDGLLGSRHYVKNPLVPLAKTVAYVNFDIQGANLLPSLRNTTFAIAAESGGGRLQRIVKSAIGRQPHDTPMLSSIFGQNRSDYASFLGANVPSVFFTDATGPCYHTSDDEIEIVDFRKLNKQIGTALTITRSLVNTSAPPAFATGTPLATWCVSGSFRPG
jgi:Zn-dependent M28 family amino/carboxypeptidase